MMALEEFSWAWEEFFAGSLVAAVRLPREVPVPLVELDASTQFGTLFPVRRIPPEQMTEAARERVMGYLLVLMGLHEAEVSRLKGLRQELAQWELGP